MRGNIYLTAIFIGGLLANVPTTASASEHACKQSPKLIGQCFSIHGRLAAYNGTPTFRIWHIGTKHILGVSDNADEKVAFPKAITRLYHKPDDPFSTYIYGNYLVCPFTKYRAGSMQYVCIQAASHLLPKAAN